MEQVYSFSKSLSGPWSEWATFAPVGTKTFSSQTTYILPVGDNAIYMGDRWNSGNLLRSTYIWLPLRISGTNVTMEFYERWSIDPNSGEWEVGSVSITYEAEAAILTKGASKVVCDNCSSHAAVSGIGGASEGAVEFLNPPSKHSRKHTVVIGHVNGAKMQSWANVTCDHVEKTLSFLPTGDWDTPGNSTLHCEFTEGTESKIVITDTSGMNNSTPYIDRIMICG